MGSSQAKSGEKLEFSDILKEALKVPCRDISFIVFSLLTAIPLFCFLVFYEMNLQRKLPEILKLIAAIYRYSYYYGHLPDDWWSPPQFSYLDYLKMIILCFICLICYHLVEIFNGIVTVGIASTLYSGEKPVRLRDIMHKSINKTRRRGPLITSMYVLFFSASAMLGLAWFITNYYILSRTFMVNHYFYVEPPRNFAIDALLTVIHGAAFIALLMKYLEWSAGWNMSVVISVLEEEEEAYGTEALELSAYYGRGSSRRGLLLMLVFFLWGVGLRLPCLFDRCSDRPEGIAYTCVYTGLICVGNAIKWVACLIYFFDCKRRILEKKVDQELGREVRVTVA